MRMWKNPSRMRSPSRSNRRLTSSGKTPTGTMSSTGRLLSSMGCRDRAIKNSPNLLAGGCSCAMQERLFTSQSGVTRVTLGQNPVIRPLQAVDQDVQMAAAEALERLPGSIRIPPASMHGDIVDQERAPITQD